MKSVAVIVSTFNQPRHLARSLLALALQTFAPFEIIVADDGSGQRTREVIHEFVEERRRSVRHVWHEDRGFRKTLILNRAVHATEADYVVFIDGDCVVKPDFLEAHLEAATPGHYLSGSMIRLNQRLSDAVNERVIESGKVFSPGWLIRQGHALNRRYLRLGLNERARHWLDEHTTTRPHWLGCDSSCYRSDLVAVNGFDHRFTYGFEDADFGNRLENHGVGGRNVRWTANVLHLWHGRPYAQAGVRERNLALVSPLGGDGWVWAPQGYREALDDSDDSVVIRDETPG